MSVTVDKVNARAKRETFWNQFLAGLSPWELHAPTKGELEMIMHDDFVEGRCSLRDIRVMLSIEPSEHDDNVV